MFIFPVHPASGHRPTVTNAFLFPEWETVSLVQRLSAFPRKNSVVSLVAFARTVNLFRSSNRTLLDPNQYVVV